MEYTYENASFTETKKLANSFPKNICQFSPRS